MIMDLIRDWRAFRRYRVTVRQLRSLPPEELRALGIAPDRIEHLAYEASRIRPSPGADCPAANALA